MIITQHVWAFRSSQARPSFDEPVVPVTTLDETIAQARPDHLVTRLVSVVPAGPSLPPETYLLTWEVSD